MRAAPSASASPRHRHARESPPPATSRRPVPPRHLPAAPPRAAQRRRHLAPPQRLPVRPARAAAVQIRSGRRSSGRAPRRLRLHAPDLPLLPPRHSALNPAATRRRLGSPPAAPSLAHAAGFWDYGAFIAVAALFEPRGFGTTGGREMGIKEVAAFLGHVGAKTSCGYPSGGYGSADGGPLAWGLCYNRELSPSQSYCDNSNELYRCVEGVEYYGRGALPVYWSYNYLEVDDSNEEEAAISP